MREDELEDRVTTQVDRHPRRTHCAELDQPRGVAEAVVGQPLDVAEVVEVQRRGGVGALDADGNLDATPAGGQIVIGVRRWAYEPGQSPPKRDSDAANTRFPRTAERRPARVEFAAGQPGALLFVADSGPGVPAANRDRVFEPFFTTKDPGQGTGLGLAIVARAVHDMGGVVWVDPAREGGAAFKMFFPIALHR
jgi:hypothetical protein